MARFIQKDYSTDPVLLAGDLSCAYCGRELLETVDTFARDHLWPKASADRTGWITEWRHVRRATSSKPAPRRPPSTTPGAWCSRGENR